MATLDSSIVVGDLRVTGDLYGEPQTFIVESTDTTAFTKALDAYKKGKVIFLRYPNPDNVKTSLVPLVQAEETSGSITKFIFAKSREFETEYIGVMEMWTCTSSSQTPVKTWSYIANANITNQATNASMAGTAAVCTGNASTAAGCTGNATTATNAARDSNNNNISNTYVTKDFFSRTFSYMFVMRNNYIKVDRSGNQYDSGTLASTADYLTALSEGAYMDLVVKATLDAGNDRTVDPVNVYAGIEFTNTSSSNLDLVPGFAGTANTRFQWPQFVKYRLIITNIGSRSATLRVVAGGRWAQQITLQNTFNGNIYLNGTVYSTDNALLPSQWDVGYKNVATIGTLAGNSSRVLEIFWYEIPPSGANAYAVHNVYVTVIK